MSRPLELRRDGPAEAMITVLLAHGAGAGMDHPWIAATAQGLAAAGLAVVRFEFPYMRDARDGVRRGPDRMPQLLACMREAAEAIGAAPGALALAGKSMGGRVATMLADELAVRAAVVFGYPFHPPKEPGQLRTAHLAALRTPTLILQGERDPFGTPPEVATYALSPAITVQWFADGDHSLAPRKRSGMTAEAHHRDAVRAAAEFIAAAGPRRT